MTRYRNKKLFDFGDPVQTVFSAFCLIIATAPFLYLGMRLFLLLTGVD